MQILATDRLILRTWQHDDIDWLATMNQDPEVMRYFPNLQDRTYTQGIIERAIRQQAECGYSLYVVEIKATGEPIGFVGLLKTNFEAHFTPATEIGWRIKSSQWRQGYAFEAASAVLHYAFTALEMEALLSFTAAINIPSRALMEKLGMVRDPNEDFYFPRLPDGHPLGPHVLYRISAPEKHQRTRR